MKTIEMNSSFGCILANGLGEYNGVACVTLTRQVPNGRYSIYLSVLSHSLRLRQRMPDPLLLAEANNVA